MGSGFPYWGYWGLKYSSFFLDPSETKAAKVSRGRQDLQDFAGFFVKHFKSVEVQKPGFWKIGKSELDDFHFMGTDLQDYH